jgi:hypothetical protein
LFFINSGDIYGFGARTAQGENITNCFTTTVRKRSAKIVNGTMTGDGYWPSVAFQTRKLRIQKGECKAFDYKEWGYDKYNDLAVLGVGTIEGAPFVAIMQNQAMDLNLKFFKTSISLLSEYFTEDDVVVGGSIAADPASNNFYTTWNLNNGSSLLFRHYQDENGYPFSVEQIFLGFSGKKILPKVVFFITIYYRI